jgi:catechol 2,3-dioxygenase-like lactoylglutathione lyase family enzyme
LKREAGRVRVSYAIVFVSDMKRAVVFYRDVLGLPLKFESPGWTEFATEGATGTHAAWKGPDRVNGVPADDELSGDRRQPEGTESAPPACRLASPPS